MRTQERIFALKHLAEMYPRLEHIGFTWKNPFNPRSRGMRWRREDLAKFREFQTEYHNLPELQTVPHPSQYFSGI